MLKVSVARCSESGWHHTRTLDTVNAVNRMQGSEGTGIFGTGNVIKTGAGTVTWHGAPANTAYRTSMLQYTGFTDIREGTFALTGIARAMFRSQR